MAKHAKTAKQIAAAKKAKQVARNKKILKVLKQELGGGWGGTLGRF